MDPGGQMGAHPNQQQRHPSDGQGHGNPGHHPQMQMGNSMNSMLNISAPPSRQGPMPSRMGPGGGPPPHLQPRPGMPPGGPMYASPGGPNGGGGGGPHGGGQHGGPPHGGGPHGGGPPQQMQQQMQQQQQQPGGAGSEEKGLVQKCARFFRTLIHLSQNESDPAKLEAHARVKELVSNVLFGSMEAEEFTHRLQGALGSKAQPHLLPFLQRTLPFLRNALHSGEEVIEGILPLSQLQSHPPHHPEMKFIKDDPSLGMPSSSASSFSSMHQFEAKPSFVSPQGPSGHPHGAPAHPQLMAEDETRTRVLTETSIKSAMIRPEDIMRKIARRITKECHMDEDVLTLISDAAEYRLRKVMSELTALTEHRLYMLKSHPNYEQVDDTRKQIRFLEEVDREYEERREAREKEILIRMSKNKKTGKETMERAKEMQKADAEVMRNRDANAAAIAALGGGRQKKKWESTATTQSSIRPRTLRVNMRDIQSVLSRDPRSKVALRLSYALSSADAQI